LNGAQRLNALNVWNLNPKGVRNAREKITMASPSQPKEEESELRSVHTANLPALFERLGISLVVSTYQAGKAILVRKDGGALNTTKNGAKFFNVP